MSGIDYEVEVIGYSHDDLADGSGKAGITLALVNCMDQTNAMNTTTGNVGGWGASRMRTLSLINLFAQIPSDLQAVIKPVLKKSSSGSMISDIQTTTDHLWLLSEIEVFGAVTRSFAGEGVHYSSRFIDATSRRKRSGGRGVLWWLRSPFATNATMFCTTQATGSSSGSSTASGTGGVCFGFCI